VTGKTIAAREHGLEEIRKIFLSGSADALRDEIYHRALEGIYQAVTKEKSNYLKYVRAGSVTASTSANRLAGLSAALKLIIDIGYTRIKFKTAISVLDHVIEILPVSEDELCEPLRGDYIKILRTLFEYAPLAEHLKVKQWRTYVDFVLAVMSISVVDENSPSSFASNGDLAVSRNTNPLSIRVSQSSKKGSASSHVTLDDLLAAMRSLTAVENAPIPSRASAIMEGILDCLSSATKSHAFAIEVFNNVALVLLGHDVRLLRDNFALLVPIARRLWSGKLPGVREPLLVTFCLCQSTIAAKPTSPIALDGSVRLQLMQTLYHEYHSRTERDILLPDDITLQFTRPGDSTNVELRPQVVSANAVAQWMLVNTLAALHRSLLVDSVPNEAPPGPDIDEHVSKRRKTSTPLEELMQHATLSSGVRRIAALQVLFALASQAEDVLLCGFFADSLEALFKILAKEDQSSTFWVLLIFSRLVGSALASEDTFRSLWMRVLDAALRATATASTARAGCLVVASVITSTHLSILCTGAMLQGSLFATGKIGPAKLTDAAIWMFIAALQSGIFMHDDTFENFSVRVISWLGTSWTLPPSADRSHNAHMATHARPELLCVLLASLKGIELRLQYLLNNPNVTPLYQQEERAHSAHKLATLMGAVDFQPMADQVWSITAHTVHLNARTRSRVEFAISEMLQNRLHDFTDSWNTHIAAGKLGGVSNDILSVAAGLCVVTRVSTGRATQDIPASSATQRSVEDLWQSLQDFISERHPDRRQRASVVAITVSRLADATDSDDFFVARQMLPCSQSTLNSLKKMSDAEDDEDDEDGDQMDSFHTGRSQNAPRKRDSVLTRVVRYEATKHATFVETIASSVLNISLLVEQGRSEGHLETQATEVILDHMLRLDSAELISARHAVYRFLDTRPSFSRNQVLRLLQSLGDACLADSDFERCEAALSMCVKAMTYLAQYWVSDQDDELADRAYEMYEWFVETGLRKGVASSTTLLHLAHLLDAVASLSPSYGDGALPSTRTNLFLILKSASCLTRLQITSNLNRVFGNYVLTEHGAIFDDVVDSLPSDPDDLDGLSTRFFVLSQLGATWHSVLKQATYSLFETAAHVTSIVDLQISAVTRMCQSLSLKSPRQLFDLFASQIFYTWLGIGSLGQIPHRVFSYDSLTDLLAANEAEVVAQIALRASQDHITNITSLLKTPWKVLLRRNFARAEAYCLASQITVPPKDRLAEKPEAAIREILGSVESGLCFHETFADIVATLIETLKDDTGIEKAFSQPGLEDAKRAFRAMSDTASTHTSQITAQQPSFRSRYLLDEVEWLRTRLDIMDSAIWSSAILVRLYRHMLRLAHPAMGPLHAVGILRRIRIVIALGSAHAVSGYPLELLLHNLRPYLTVFQSSGDAIMIYRYLLEHGQAHLQNRLSFLAGLSISIFAALTTFISSSQDSTTQESHFRSTMSKAQDFRRWLNRYLDKMSPPPHDAAKFELFKGIIAHAAAMTGSGSNSLSSHQGSVLLGLLNDQASEDPLLQALDFDLSIEILSKNFESVGDASDDILASGADAARLRPVLERILRIAGIHEKLRTWIAQSLGRGVSWQGPFTTSDGVDSSSPASKATESLDDVASYRSIVEFWERLLWKQDPKAAASAEQCLQTIASQLDQAQTAAILGSSRSATLLDELRFVGVSCPPMLGPLLGQQHLPSLKNWNSQPHEDWATDLLIAICAQALDNPVLQVLQQFTFHEPHVAKEMLPYAVHLVLATELDNKSATKQALSSLFAEVFEKSSDDASESARYVLKIVVYLRRCVMPNEKTIAQRSTWVDIDWAAASRTAVHCQWWHTALLFIELQRAHAHLLTTRTSRRSTLPPALEMEVIARIYQHVDDPDYFYAGHQDVDVDSVVRRLGHESSGDKLLSFQSALYDSYARSGADEEHFASATLAAAKALSTANMKGISQSIRSVSNDNSLAHGQTRDDLSRSMLDWDVGPDDTGTVTQVAIQHLQVLSSAADKHSLVSTLDAGLGKIAARWSVQENIRQDYEAKLIGLAVLTEAKDVLRASGQAAHNDILDGFSQVEAWGAKGNFETVSQFLNAREYILGCVSRSPQLRAAVSLTAPQVLLGEARVVRQSLLLAQQHDSHQFSLARATYFAKLSSAAERLGVTIDVSSQFDMAQTLWRQDERAAAVKILQDLRARKDLSTQDIPVARSEILAELGQQVSQARLEPARDVIENYLVPASEELRSDSSSAKAGHTYHVFAAFCDGQLQDQENRDEYVRLTEIREAKAAEVHELERLQATDPSKQAQYKSALKSARKWYELDNIEWERVRQSRENLVAQCLENYLQSMRVCDTYQNDTLRVLTIWLEEADNHRATEVVYNHIRSVPSWKFAGLMSQLLSRLQDTEDAFQQCLVDLTFRICSDHPHHSLYQLFAASKTRSARGDEAGKSRYDAVNKLAKLVQHKSPQRDLWAVIHNTNVAFVGVAQAKLDEKVVRQNSKLSLREVRGGEKLIADVANARIRIPAPTMRVSLRSDKDYTSVSTMVKLESTITVAGGISAPKIATALISDGTRHKMLMKGGNDDLRQDSIMEQVFEQVSNLLGEHPATRKRKVGIRTYRVVPLLSNAGIIEFVQNTMSLQDYLFPGHKRYFPNDYSSSRCRNFIDNVRDKSPKERVDAYRMAIQKFHPVMRFFFMENFPDPDDWFYKRLNYSRSMAATSMLGHVLGIGDRHTQNILLDTMSGEVVHIDLGIAFEQGRILPIPETVPFRLTRDMVDGMGISGLEGVYRRCCNFTLEALRLEQESIMTILDVLRYDPLYSWSVSPLRLAKMQENAQRAALLETSHAAAGGHQDSVMTSSSAANGIRSAVGAAFAQPAPVRRVGEVNESGEAARALAVVAKKLGKGLSVEAMVNELIRQATDEKNLALLFSGWAAYA
jgi:serine-protein kinase ATM